MLYIKLFLFHDLSRGFGRLTHIDSSPLIKFSQFHHLIYWELSFLIYFDFFSMKLLLSHVPSRESDKLSQVDLDRSNMSLSEYLKIKILY